MWKTLLLTRQLDGGMLPLIFRSRVFLWAFSLFFWGIGSFFIRSPQLQLKGDSKKFSGLHRRGDISSLSFIGIIS